VAPKNGTSPAGLIGLRYVRTVIGPNGHMVHGPVIRWMRTRSADWTPHFEYVRKQLPQDQRSCIQATPIPAGNLTRQPIGARGFVPTR
jgi:hypothetical protein